MWAERARDEHDAFSELLATRGVRVHHFQTLLAEALATEDGRAFAVNRVCTDERFGGGAGDTRRQGRGLEELIEKKDWFTLAEFARTTLTPYDFGEVLTEMFGETGECRPVRTS